TQIKIRKPLSDDDLSIAVLPKDITSLVNECIPLIITPKEGGISKLTLCFQNLKYLSSAYRVYLLDRYTEELKDIRVTYPSEYNVPDPDQITDDRFYLVLTKVGQTPEPNIPSSNPTFIEDVETDDFSNIKIRTEGSNVIVSDVPESMIGEPIKLYNLRGQLEATTVAEKENVLEAQSTGIHAVSIDKQGTKKILIGKVF
ncbi:MAG: hypothetical protein Q4C30_09640, partial [Bacteroidia bacterium]|nr:hypothetical protein [Bacteroidia bacterium]